MGQCLSPAQMSYFLNLLTVPYDMANDILTIHATEGPARWLWDGVAFCYGAGFAA